MTAPLDIDALAAVIDDMSPAPWSRSTSDCYVATNARRCDDIRFDKAADAVGVVALVNSAPQLIARIRELEQALGECRALMLSIGRVGLRYQQGPTQADCLNAAKRIRAVLAGEGAP